MLRGGPRDGVGLSNIQWSELVRGLWGMGLWGMGL